VRSALHQEVGQVAPPDPTVEAAEFGGDIDESDDETDNDDPALTQEECEALDRELSRLPAGA